VRDIAVEHGIVATIGTLRVYPGSPNVIPGQVDIGIEIRGLDESVLDKAAEALVQRAVEMGATFEEVSRKPPVMSDPMLVDVLADVSAELALSYRKMPSGAGHDAMCIAAIAPQAMLFVPNCVEGARVLLGALLRLDASL
jgi:acetylornithine deacetylase/succinyl-diaminopimelate desuccinylase-like protein